MRLTTMILLVGLLLVGPLVACGSEASNPASLVVGPRILAAAATPAVVELDGAAALHALVVDQRGTVDNPRLSWRACSPWRPVLDPDRDCSEDQALQLDGAEVAVADVIERYPPPIGAVDFSSPSRAAGSCAAVPIFELPLVAEAEVDGERLVALRRLGVTLAEPDGVVEPRLGELVIDGDPGKGSFAAGAEHELLVTFAGRRDELAAECDFVSRVHIYGSTGSLGENSLDIEYDDDGVATIMATEWTASDADTAWFWVVAATEIGTTSWRSFALTVAD